MYKMNLLFCFLLTFSSGVLRAQSLLEDLDGDGVTSIVAFGDSITSGVGDGISVGEFIEVAGQFGGGYPSRVSNLLDVPVTNSGVPGEVATSGGVDRFLRVASTSSADIFIIMEGTNDAIFETSTSVFRDAIQSMVNATVALGKQPVVVTLIPPCCDRDGRQFFTNSYNQVLIDLAIENEIPLVDLETLWVNTCENQSECELLNIPEGLHPNSRGYDLVAHAVMATLLGIDLMVPGGAEELENALGLEEGTVFAQPQSNLGE